jgi:hypothetical protein
VPEVALPLGPVTPSIGTAVSAATSGQHGMPMYDTLPVAAMQANGPTNLAAQDTDFDRVPGLVRHAPDWGTSRLAISGSLPNCGEGEKWTAMAGSCLRRLLEVFLRLVRIPRVGIWAAGLHCQCGGDLPSRAFRRMAGIGKACRIFSHFSRPFRD